MRVCVCMCVRARAFLVMHAHMCSGPIGLVTALQSAILIMQHFIKSSRWVSEWEEAERAEREKEGEEKDRKQRERERERERDRKRSQHFTCVHLCVWVCARCIPHSNWIFVLSLRACVSVLSLCLCLLSFVTLHLLVVRCVCVCLCSSVHVLVRVSPQSCSCVCLCTWLVLGCISVDSTLLSRLCDPFNLS